MNRILAVTTFALMLSPIAAHAEYEQVNLAVFGMDCAPCAHAIHASMKGITGSDYGRRGPEHRLVRVKLIPGNSAAMRQFNPGGGEERLHSQGR